MKILRIKAVLLQEFFITKHSLEIFMDMFLFPMVNIVIFGFLSLYLSGNNNSVAGQYVLLGMLLWNIIWIIEYSVCIGSMWNIWFRNLSNMFIAPLQVKEFLLAHTLSGMIKALVVLLFSSILSVFVFNFNLLNVGITSLILIFINFSFFAFSLGIIMLGLIFRYGTRVQALAWGIVPIIQPLSAAFYPLHILPLPLQFLAYIFPPTFTFEAARQSLTYHTVDWQLFLFSFGENIIYCIASILFFNYMFTKSKDTGQFARNES
ncbi:MAG TPA: ABC transporter permease [Candidatus Saccharimonadales bacterium]|nr:ABC transporter permease [Candidatus Saccharimonadales bacterium]